MEKVDAMFPVYLSISNFLDDTGRGHREESIKHQVYAGVAVAKRDVI